MKSHCLKNGVTDLSMPRQGNSGPRMNTCNRVESFAVLPEDEELKSFTQDIGLKVDKFKNFLKITGEPVVRPQAMFYPFLSLC